MLTEIAISEAERWNEIVRSFRNYDVFYLNEYSSAFMKEDRVNGMPFLIYFENGRDRAVSVVFRRDVALDEHMRGKIGKGRYYDIITPYGYGGFAGEVEDYGTLNREYNEYCLSNNYVCEFVRFALFNDYYKHFKCIGDQHAVVENKTHNVVRSLDMPIEDIWMDFKQKVRKNVKRAQKNRLEIVAENTGEHIDDFLDIYYGTMERSKADRQYYFSGQFYKRLNRMADNIMYFHVVHERKIISTELVIYGSENAYSYLGGTDSKYFDLRPNDFLKWEIIKWAKDKGLKNFVLGGGYGSDDGIFQYKSSLAPHGIVDFYIGRRIFDMEAYDYLCRLRGVESHSAELDKIGYFPEYRVGGVIHRTPSSLAA